ncbi:hypothetical protein FHP25_33970 [Vineibacter terrae]|uniref:Uncharacterized protein n=1 Tax=Vineibacter terrae TaxID=2586908 RepID=A0A5C8PAT8_9HYPH|nr:hypothetical protein [Vineibacter terrae]TXL70544.1 hypothetical protein FHP25_33970 [Vineibacter terrae]
MLLSAVVNEADHDTVVRFDRCASQGLARLKFKSEPAGLYTVEASIRPEGRSRWQRVFVAPETPLADLGGFALGAMGEALERLGPLSGAGRA